jgi:Cu(I)/Ag(I) efflux system membrane protein CusA/SilA
MVGGMITAPLLSLFVIPAIYLLWRQRAMRNSKLSVAKERTADQLVDAERQAD